MTYSLIPSAAYIDVELAAEFGRIPPAFLPVGHRRLYELQVESLGNGDCIYLTLPQSYELAQADAAALQIRKVHLLQIPDGLSLGRSIQYALDLIGRPSEPLRILHGDTLIPLAPLDQMDVVAVGAPPNGYEWGQYATDSMSSSNVIAGYFALSDQTEFRRSLSLANGDFTRALSIYSSQIGLTDIVVDTWLDFGHLQPFYRSRCNVRTQRSFNEIHLDFQRIRKTGKNQKKIGAEAAWYRSLPDALRLYTPAYLGSGTNEDGQLWYELEYLPLPSLHELFVFGELSASSWKNIFQGCVQFLDGCRKHLSQSEARQIDQSPSLRETIRAKTTSRLGGWLQEQGLSLDGTWSYCGKELPTIRQIVERTTQEIDDDDGRYASVMHGDFCFTNIFFDFRTMRVRAIDPRGGLNDNDQSLLGDWRYDLAKMSHSVIGCYDLILAGRYHLAQNAQYDVTLRFLGGKAVEFAQDQFECIQFGELNPKSKQIMAIVIHLFLSMIPLHNDRPDRQMAFFANALRLYSEYFSES